MREILQNKDFIFFLLSRFCSSLAFSILLITLLKWIEIESHSTDSISLFFVINAMPALLLSLPLGAWIQNKNKLHILLYSNFIWAVLGMLFVIFYHSMHFYWAFFIIILDSIFILIVSPTEKTLLPFIVNNEKLIHYNSLVSFADISPIILGKIVTAIAIEKGISIHHVLIFYSVISSLSFILLLQLKHIQEPPIQKETSPILSTIKNDLKFLSKDSLLKKLFFLIIMIFIISYPIHEMLLSNYLLEVMGTGIEKIGYFSSLLILGSISVLPFIPYLYRRFERKYFFVLTPLIYIVFISLFLLKANLVWIGIACFFAGVFTNILTVFTTNLIQQRVSSKYYGSAFGLQTFLARGIKCPAIFVATIGVSGLGFHTFGLVWLLLACAVFIGGLLFIPKIN